MSFLAFDPISGKPKKNSYSQTIVTLKPHDDELDTTQLNAFSESENEESNEIEKSIIKKSDDNEILVLFTTLLTLFDCKNDNKVVEEANFDFGKLKSELVWGRIQSNDLKELEKKICEWIDSLIVSLDYEDFDVDLLGICFLRFNIVTQYYNILDKQDINSKKEVKLKIKEFLTMPDIISNIIHDYNHEFILKLSEPCNKTDTIPLYNLFNIATLHKLLMKEMGFEYSNEIILINRKFPHTDNFHTFHSNLIELLNNLFGNINFTKDDLFDANIVFMEEAKLFLHDIIDAIFFWENLLSFSFGDEAEKFSKFFIALIQKVNYPSSRIDSHILSNLKLGLLAIAEDHNHDVDTRISMVISLLTHLTSFIEIPENLLDDLSYNVYWTIIFNCIKDGDISSVELIFESFYNFTENRIKFCVFIYLQYQLVFTDWMKKPQNTGFIEIVISTINILEPYLGESLFQKIKYYERKAKELLTISYSFGRFECRSIENDGFISIEKSEKVLFPKFMKDPIKRVRDLLREEKKDVSFNSSYMLAELEYSLGTKIYTLECNGFHAMILLAFQENDTLTLKQLLKETGMLTKNLVKCIRDVIYAGILNSDDIDDILSTDDILSIDEGYDNIKISLNSEFTRNENIINIGIQNKFQ